MLLVALWVNRSYPGLSLAFLGVLLNALVIVVNGGYMPIWEPALVAAGLTEADVTRFHTSSTAAARPDFLGRLLILGDVIPIPIPVIQNVASLGDLFLTLGLAFFLFAGVVRVPTPEEQRDATSAALAGGRRDGASPNRRPARADRAAPADRRPRHRAPWIGRAAPRASSAARLPAPPAAQARRYDGADGPIPRPSPEVVARVRRHPYVRLALNGSFSALWAGQLISLFGDRIHQVAIAAVVVVTGLADRRRARVRRRDATEPAPRPDRRHLRRPLGPQRGPGRQRHPARGGRRAHARSRRSPTSCSSTRSVFLVTTISIFFRPARVAILPRIVREDEPADRQLGAVGRRDHRRRHRLPAGGPVRGARRRCRPVAFWFDAATYLASALLLSTLIPRPADRGPASEAMPTGEPHRPGFAEEASRSGWRFLRNEPVLLANTLQASVAQFTIGVLIGQTAVYADRVFGARASTGGASTASSRPRSASATSSAASSSG